MVQITKICGLENKDLKVVQAPPRQGPKTFPDKPFLGTIVGSRGSGKTNCMINLIKHYDKTGFFSKVYMFSPTSFGNDPKYQLLEDGKHNIEYKKYPTYSDEIFKEVLEEIKSDIEEYKD
jgi:pantothenate kinase-related protein Tda10